MKSKINSNDLEKLKSINKLEIFTHILEDCTCENIKFENEIEASLLIDYPFIENDEFPVYEYHISFISLNELMFKIRECYYDIFESGDFEYALHSMSSLWIEYIEVDIYNNGKDIIISPMMGS